jgi:hypothetical protein
MLRHPQNFARFGSLWFAVLALMAVLHSAPAHAYPVLEQEVFYHGGALQFEILPFTAAYTNQIFLRTATGTIFLGNNTNVGLVINISDPSALGLTPRDEFVLGIHVVNTGHDFVMGGGYDNPDGIAHASVNYLYSHTAVIGFEDLFGGGDLDYDDARVRVVGNIGLVQIAEPSSLILVGSGILGLVFVSRRWFKKHGLGDSKSKI